MSDKAAAMSGKTAVMSGKTIICRCEDVTLDDVHCSFELGYATVEEVKRYTGLGTGPCQGKECMVLAARLIVSVAHLGGAPATVAPFTARPPLESAPLAIFVAAAGDDEDPAR